MEENETAKVTIVIPVHNRRQYTLNCLKQLQSIDKDGMDITTVVVDDGSTDGTSEKIAQEYPEVVLLHGNGSLWWSGSTNMGVEYALKHNSDYILTLNDDTQFEKDFLVNLFLTVKTNNDTIVCAVAFYEDQNKKELSEHNLPHISQKRFNNDFTHREIEYEYKKDMGTGCAMLIPCNIFIKIGLFDFKKFPHHMGDLDFLLRAKKEGCKVLKNPKAVLYTKIGDNYFHIQIIKKSLWYNVKWFFNIKSSVNLRTRWNYYWRHTRYFLGWIPFLYFLLRMSFAIACKLLLPTKTLIHIMSKRAFYVNVNDF